MVLLGKFVRTQHKLAKTHNTCLRLKPYVLLVILCFYSGRGIQGKGMGDGVAGQDTDGHAQLKRGTHLLATGVARAHEVFIRIGRSCALSRARAIVIRSARAGLNDLAD